MLEKIMAEGKIFYAHGFNDVIFLKTHTCKQPIDSMQSLSKLQSQFSRNKTNNTEIV